MKDPKEEQWYFNNITDIGPSSVSYFDVHILIYTLFFVICVLYDSEINTNKQTNKGRGNGYTCISEIVHYDSRWVLNQIDVNQTEIEYTFWS